MQSLEARQPASRERALLWHLAARGKITKDKLYQRLAALREDHGDDCYDAPRHRCGATDFDEVAKDEAYA
jgi:hypothetical protein